MRKKNLAALALWALAAGILTGLSVSAQEQTPEQPKLETPAEVDFSGVYKVWGRNPDFTEYTGYAEIVKVNEVVYAMRWQTVGGEVIGVGIAHDGKLAVSVHGNSTIVIYEPFDDDGCLAGMWTVLGNFELHPEMLTKLPAGTKFPEPKLQTHSSSAKPTIKTAV